MVTLSQVISHLHPKRSVLVDFMVSDDGQGPFISMWSANMGEYPTEEEIASASSEIEATNAARNAFQAGIAVGFAVEPEGFTIGMTDEDRNQFAQLILHLNLKGALETQQVPLSDKAGAMHVVTFARFKEVMKAMGDAYTALWLARKG